jgi:hypothetical protein
MVIGVAVAAHNATRREQDDLLRDLRLSVKGGLKSATSEQTRLAGEIRAFLEWVDDPKPEFSEDVDGEDKFARLIELSRGYEECTSFFVSEVGVNASTVWRWATDKSRPSKYVGKRLAQEVKGVLSQALWTKAMEMQLLSPERVR